MAVNPAYFHWFQLAAAAAVQEMQVADQADQAAAAARVQPEALEALELLDRALTAALGHQQARLVPQAAAVEPVQQAGME